MAAARRLSELLQEQQEPFLVQAAFRARRPRRGSPGPGSCCPATGAAAACRRLLSLCNHGFKKRRSGGVTGAGGLRSALSKVLCGRAMRWEDLAGGGCFSGAGGCGGREFCRLGRYSGECDPRTMEFGEEKDEQGRWKDDVDSSRQLSPVSVLDRRSDDGSPVHSPWDDDDEKPSTSGSSPPSDAFLGPASPCFSYNISDKFRDMDVDESRNGGKSIEEQVSSWEKIAGDISRIPSMMELDLRQSAPQWREHRPEVAEIGARIETLIFDDISREGVRDMLGSHCCTLC